MPNVALTCEMRQLLRATVSFGAQGHVGLWVGIEPGALTRLEEVEAH